MTTQARCDEDPHQIKGPMLAKKSAIVRSASFVLSDLALAMLQLLLRQEAAASHFYRWRPRPTTHTHAVPGLFSVAIGLLALQT